MGVKRLQIKDDLNQAQEVQKDEDIAMKFFHDGLVFFYTEEALKSDKSLIGFYFDRLGFAQEIHRSSLYGSYLLKGTKTLNIANPKEEYEPYGPEWEKEMMKLDKKTLITMLKAQGLEV